MNGLSNKSVGKKGHRDYSIGNIVNNTVIITYAVRGCLKHRGRGGDHPVST